MLLQNFSMICMTNFIWSGPHNKKETMEKIVNETTEEFNRSLKPRKFKAESRAKSHAPSIIELKELNYIIRGDRFVDIEVDGSYIEVKTYGRRKKEIKSVMKKVFLEHLDELNKSFGSPMFLKIDGRVMEMGKKALKTQTESPPSTGAALQPMVQVFRR